MFDGYNYKENVFLAANARDKRIMLLCAVWVDGRLASAWACAHGTTKNCKCVQKGCVAYDSKTS